MPPLMEDTTCFSCSQFEICHWMLFLLIFFCFLSISDPTSHSLPHLSPLCLSLLCLSPYVFTLMNRRQEHNSIGTTSHQTTHLLGYQHSETSCCGSSSPESCAGTSSAATERSHHSKFRTSQTWSTSRSASTTRRLLVIERFLATTAARSP